MMTQSKKEITVACSYLLRLMKAHVQLSSEQIAVFKRTFYDVLSKRFVGHWFPATPHRGSAYRCLQTKHGKDPVLKVIAERSRLPIHRYLPAIFTIWIDPGEVSICFGDEGTWCPLYKHDINGEIHQAYSDGEETTSSSSDDDILSLTQSVESLAVNDKIAEIPSNTLTTTQIQETNNSRSSSSLANSSRASSPFVNTTITPNTDYNYLGKFDSSNFYRYQSVPNDWNDQQANIFWPQQQQQPTSDAMSYHPLCPGEDFRSIYQRD